MPGRHPSGGYLQKLINEKKPLQQSRVVLARMEQVWDNSI